ncbi:MAG: serine hydrolase [Actinomycetes bacterium]
MPLKRLAVLVAISALLTVAPASAAGASAGPETMAKACGAAAAYLRTRADTVSVFIKDRQTGARCVLNGAQHYDTASIVKVSIVTAVLLRAQRRGRGLTDWEQDKARLAITRSDNNATSALWKSLGQGPGLVPTMSACAMQSSTPGPAGYWGLTRTTAVDQGRLLMTVTRETGPLSKANRTFLLSLMHQVVPGQRWGISAGAARVRVELKNGWLPRSSRGWRVHSIGRVSGDGRDYVIAVLTDRNPTMDYGVRTIEGVSRAAFAQLR